MKIGESSGEHFAVQLEYHQNHKIFSGNISKSFTNLKMMSDILKETAVIDGLG